MNSNETTGYRFGYIAANSLDSELVDALMYEHGKNLTYAEAELDEIARQRTEWEEQMERAVVAYQESDPLNLRRGSPDTVFDDFEPDLDNFHPEIYEPTIEGTFEGVTYRSSWLGGALNFFILESPMVGRFDLCSPCVPGAGNLDSRNSNGALAYDVPVDWRHKEPDDGKTFADRMGEHE